MLLHIVYPEGENQRQKKMRVRLEKLLSKDFCLGRIGPYVQAFLILIFRNRIFWISYEALSWSFIPREQEFR